MSHSLELALAAIEKQYGKGAIIDSSEFKVEGIEIIPTGNYELDRILGVGGLPTGRITEIYGGEGLGKSLLALMLTANAQKAGHKVLYIDAECDLDPTWAQKMGVDMDNLLICQPDYAEQGLDIAETLLKTGEIKLIIIDSVAAMTPKDVVDGEITDSHVALSPRMWAQFIGMVRPIIKKTDTCLVFLNQIRDKIGFMQQGTQSPGGRAIKFYSSVRIELKRMGDYRESNEIAGVKVKAKTIKNKVYPPYKEIVYNVINDYGVDNISAIMEDAAKHGIVLKSGSWIYMTEINKETGEITKGPPVGNGSKQWREYFNEFPEILEKIKTEIKEKENSDG